MHQTLLSCLLIIQGIRRALGLTKRAKEGEDGVSIQSDTLRSEGYWSLGRKSLTLRTHTNPSWELFVVFS